MSRSGKNLIVSPRTAPSKEAKLCTYHHWFGRASILQFEPYYELPMVDSKLRALEHFRERREREREREGERERERILLVHSASIGL